MSDWFQSSGYNGETVVASTPYLNKANGTTQTGTYDLYGYSFKLDSTKTVRSITMPSNNNVRIMAMTLS